MRYIFTCQSNLGKILLSEFKKEDSSFNFIDWLDAGVGLMDSNLTLNEIIDLIFKSPIIFIRHIFRVDDCYEISSLVYLDNKEQILTQCIEFLKLNINKDSTFSIQSRSISNDLLNNYKRELTSDIVNYLVNEGYNQDIKNCDQIISLFITKKNLFIGYSLSGQNLSKWNGGMMHCSKEDMQISRAKSKLLEAIEVFKIPIEKYKHGIDLGAAPGGWTEVLLDYNLEAIAIDPADMDNILLNNPKLKHYKETTQQFLKRNIEKEYDIIVNDMKMDILPSVQITNEFKNMLSKNGIIVITFKLPHKFTYTLIKQGMEELKKCYKIITARQLFHNRSEITVICKNKTNEARL